MSAIPSVCWITGGVRERLHKVAYERNMCAEELAGDLLTAALHCLEPQPPGTGQPPVLNLRALREALREVPDE